MDLLQHNRQAWDRAAQRGDRWSSPVDAATVARAREGQLDIVLTPTKVVPAAWWPEPLAGCRVLGLAASGGQQAPLLAAAGAAVTVLDNSPGQLARDAEVAEREGLSLQLDQGDMRDLSRYDEASFDLVIHPCSNCFVPDVRVVWREIARVLRPGGVLISGFCLPVRFALDPASEEGGPLLLTSAIPYSDLEHLDNEIIRRWIEDDGEPVAFGHSLGDQIGGQLEAGLVLTGFYDDADAPDRDPISGIMPSFAATRAIKPG